MTEFGRSIGGRRPDEEATMQTETADERRIPIPSDFPVAWEQPDDPERFFEREKSNFPLY